MDRHRSLYKENSSMLSPRQHNRLNRELQQGNRAKQRGSLFLSNRNIIVSPTPSKDKPQVATSTPAVSTINKQKKPLLFVAPKSAAESADKENSTVVIKSTGDKSIYSSRIGKVTSVTNVGNLSRPEAFLLRFIEWKEAKKKETLEKQAKAKKFKPFVPSGTISGNSMRNAATFSFAPKNHQFNAPEGLKNPAAAGPVAAGSNKKLRRSLYTVVSTPPRKNLPVSCKALPAPHLKRFESVPTKLALANATTAAAASKSNKLTANKQKVKVAAIANQGTAKKIKPPPNLRSTPGCFQKNTTRNPELQPKPFNKPAASNTAAKAAPSRPPVKPPAPTKKSTSAALATTKIEPRPAPRNVKPFGGGVARNIAGAVSASVGGGAIGKAKVLQQKRANLVSNACSQPTQKATKLSVCMKAKRPVGTATAAVKRFPGQFKLTEKTLLNIPSAQIVAETPTDGPNTNPFEAFVTSTKHKTSSTSLSQADEELTTMCDTISPVEAVQTQHECQSADVGSRRVLSAKRTLLQEAVKQQQITKDVKPKEGETKRKFNFLRCSVGNITADELDNVLSTGNDAEEEAAEIIVTEKGNDDAMMLQQPKSSFATADFINDIKPKEGETKRKFNFLRYSVGNITADELDNVLSTGNDAEEEAAEIIVTEKGNDDAMTLQQPKSSFATAGHKSEIPHSPEHTPGKEHNAEPPVNYLSPFVSVSRGKVNSRKEQEKRNSIYLPTASIVAEDVSVAAPISEAFTETPQLSVEARRTLETVRYLRRQLADEIARLHTLCDQWETYKAAHLACLQETSGEDMINVTIGQTKLLTSKKFMQFKGLIDRCEASARGVAAAVDDGSEKTKPITSVDLEGFWSMVGLQVDNVEKRFANLERWKANDWVDPDEVTKVKEKKNLNKVKKAKVNNITSSAACKGKANSELRKMMIQMHADMRKKKAADSCIAAGGDVTLTPTSHHSKHRSQSGTTTKPGRISIVVPDRKSRSAAATVVSIPTPTRCLSLLALKRSLDSPKLSPHVQELERSLTDLQNACNSSELFKSALINANNHSNDKKRRKSQARMQLSIPPRTPTHTPAHGRKSILKTPGTATAKGKPKCVGFNENLRIKKFKFTVEESADSDEELK